MPRSKWPEYDPATDGNPFRWILEAAERARNPDSQIERRTEEAKRIARRSEQHGNSQETRSEEAGQP
jgi:hypothetical protein